MVGESAAGSNNRSHQEVDLEQLVHARAKNALWRSWSLEGLSEANRDEKEPAVAGDQRRPSLKNSPKAWEVFYERFLEDMGESSLAVELARRQHGDADISPGGMSAEGGRLSADDVATAAAAAAAPLAMCEMGGGSNAPIRGGQLFGHFAGGGGGGTFAGPVGHGHSEDYGGHVLTQPLAESGASELAFRLSMAGSYDQHEHQKRAEESSAGPTENSAAAAAGEDPADAPIKPSLSDPILGLGIDETPTSERLKLLRKAFTQARNQRRKDVPDDTVSAFLGDDLSVHYYNYFGSLWAGRNSRIGSGASSDTSGGGGPSEPSRWEPYDTAGVAATGGSHARFVDGGQQPQQQPQPRRWRRGETGQSGGRTVGGGGGGGIRGAPFGTSRGMVSTGDLRGAGTAASAAAAGYPSAMGAAAESPRGPERAGSTGALATLFASPSSGKEEAMDLSASVAAAAAGARYVPGMGMQVASSSDEFSPRRTTGITPPYELAAAQEEIIVGSLPPTPPVRKRRGMSARSTSALDKLVNEQDRGQAVMMPLMDWNDWNADRLHWTFPAVVHAFPRCLYNVAGAGARRHERGGTRSTTGRGGRCDPSHAAGNVNAAAAAAACLVMPPVGILPEEGSGLLRGIRKAWEIGSRESGGGGGGGGMFGVPDNRSGVQEEKKCQEPHAGARGQREGAHQGGNAAGGISGVRGEHPRAPPDSTNPFEPLSLGEVYIRTAPSSELGLAGVGAGPWRRRWLVLRQTYVFELLQPPPPSVPTLSFACDLLPLSKPLGASSLVRAPVAGSSLAGGLRSGAGVDGSGGHSGGGAGRVGAGGGSGGGGEGGNRSARETGAFGDDLDRTEEEAVTPVGFLCLSKASVENGGINWGPKTLLLRCESRPSTMSREEISAAANVGVDLAATAAIGRRGRAGKAREEIRVELRLPNEEAGERWAALIRDRANLEMSTLFEPSPSDLEEYAAGVGNESDANNDGDVDTGFGCDPVAETETDFSVLGQGRYSKVVCAKRKQPWARPGRNVCAIKVVDKQAFWSRVRSGKERVDSLAREVFCQTSLTIKGAEGDGDYGSPDAAFAAGNSEDDLGGDQKEEAGQGQDDCPAEPSSQRPSGDETVAADGMAGGGIVRIHSIMETADDLILEMDLMSRTDLFDRLQELNGAFTERQAAGMARNLLLAIDKINRLGFCHRDVKPANLLYPGPGSSLDPVCVVLADFGMATKAGRDGLVRGRCGTVGFVAPEILRAGKQEGYGMNVDIFSAGAVLYMCLCGYEPFFGLTDKEIKAANRRAEFAFVEGWEEVSGDAKDLITKMMDPDPTRRITPSEALQHPWIVEHNQ